MIKETIDEFDDLWNKYKYKISGKIAILLACTAGLAGLLNGIDYLSIPTNIFLAITNIGVFFAGISLEKFSQENKKLHTDNVSLKCEKNDLLRRYTVQQGVNLNTHFNFPPTDSIDDNVFCDNFCDNNDVNTSYTNEPTHINESPIKNHIIFTK